MALRILFFVSLIVGVLIFRGTTIADTGKSERRNKNLISTIEEPNDQLQNRWRWWRGFGKKEMTRLRSTIKKNSENIKNNSQAITSLKQGMSTLPKFSENIKNNSQAITSLKQGMSTLPKFSENIKNNSQAITSLKQGMSTLPKFSENIKNNSQAITSLKQGMSDLNRDMRGFINRLSEVEAILFECPSQAGNSTDNSRVTNVLDTLKNKILNIDRQLEEMWNALSAQGGSGSVPPETPPVGGEPNPFGDNEQPQKEPQKEPTSPERVYRGLVDIAPVLSVVNVLAIGTFCVTKFFPVARQVDLGKVLEIIWNLASFVLGIVRKFLSRLRKSWRSKAISGPNNSKSVPAVTKALARREGGESSGKQTSKELKEDK